MWHVPGHFPTIQAAIDSSKVVDGDTIVVRHPVHTGATVTKAVTIKAQHRVTIWTGRSSARLGKAGFLFPGDGAGSGATITGLSFDKVEFPVFSRGADDVSVTQQHDVAVRPGRHQLGQRQVGQRLGDLRQR